MKNKILIISLFFSGIILGGFFRFNNLENNVVWDGDASGYAIYGRKYYEIFKTAWSEKFQKLWETKKAGANYINFETLVQEIKKQPEYQKLTEGIEKTSRTFPDWANKPAFVMTGAFFHFLNNKDNSILYMTALFGTLIIPFSFWLFYKTGRKPLQAAFASFLIAFSPMLVGYSRIGYSQIASIFFLIFFFYFYYRSHETCNRVPIVAAGFFLGIAQAYHPVVMLWLFFSLCYEFIQNIRRPRELFSRIFFLTLGYISILLLLEIFQLYLWHLSLIFAGAPIRSYFHMLFLHSQNQSGYPFDPFFYVKSISLYEGIPFCVASLLAIYALLRNRKQFSQNGFMFFFFFFPLAFLSLFSWRFPLALRNIPFILIPGYFLISNALVNLFGAPHLKWKSGAVILALAVIHILYCSHVNWSNAHYMVPGEEIKSFIGQFPDRKLIAPQGNLFLENLLHQMIPDRSSGGGKYIFFYKGVAEHQNDPRIAKIFMTDAFDKRMFLLEDPRGLAMFFKPEERVLYNRIFFAFEKL